MSKILVAHIKGTYGQASDAPGMLGNPANISLPYVQTTGGSCITIPHKTLFPYYTIWSFINQVPNQF